MRGGETRITPKGELELDIIPQKEMTQEEETILNEKIQSDLKKSLDNPKDPKSDVGTTPFAKVFEDAVKVAKNKENEKVTVPPTEIQQPSKMAYTGITSILTPEEARKKAEMQRDREEGDPRNSHIIIKSQTFKEKDAEPINVPINTISEAKKISLKEEIKTPLAKTPSSISSEPKSPILDVDEIINPTPQEKSMVAKKREAGRVEEKPETPLERSMREAKENLPESLEKISSFRELRGKLEELRIAEKEAKDKNPLDLRGGLANQYSKYIEAIDDMSHGSRTTSTDEFYPSEVAQAIEDLKDNKTLLGVALKLYDDKRSYFLDVENGSHKGFVQSFDDREKAKIQIAEKDKLKNVEEKAETEDDEPKIDDADIEPTIENELPAEDVEIPAGAEGKYSAELKAIEDARANYAKEYISWVTSEKKKGAINKIKNTLGLKSDHTRFISEKNADDLPTEFKLARANYNQLRENLFKKMAEDKEAEIKEQIASGNLIVPQGQTESFFVQETLKQYKTGELFDKLVIKERQSFIEQRIAEQDALSKRLLEWPEGMTPMQKTVKSASIMLGIVPKLIFRGAIGSSLKKTLDWYGRRNKFNKLLLRSAVFGGAVALTGGGVLAGMSMMGAMTTAGVGSMVGASVTSGAHEFFTRGSRRETEAELKKQESEGKTGLSSGNFTFAGVDEKFNSIQEERAYNQRKHLMKKGIYTAIGGLATGGALRYANSAGMLDAFKVKIDSALSFDEPIPDGITPVENPNPEVGSGGAEIIPPSDGINPIENQYGNPDDFASPAEVEEMRDIPRAIPVEGAEALNDSLGLNSYEVSATAGRKGEWGIIEEILEKQGKLNASTPEGVRTHMIDQFYNKVEDLSRSERLAIGLGPEMGQVRTGATVNMSGIFAGNSESLISESRNITPIMQEQITKNNALIRDWARKNPGTRLTERIVEQIINGKR